MSSFMILDMVVSKSTSVVHPRPCIKETMMPVGHSAIFTGGGGAATLPRVRVPPRRVAELPSLRYGPVGASCTVSGPLKVAANRQPPSTTLPRKYSRNFTAAVMGDDVPAIRSTQPRRVRFDLPPSPTDVSPLSASTPPTDIISDGLRSRSRPSFFSSNRSSTLRRTVYEPVQSVTVVSSTTSVRERVHPVTAYVRGTLAPTAPAPSATTPPGAQALLRAAREHNEAQIKEVLRCGVGREVNAVDSSGRTALSYVISNGSVDILELMLQIPGIDPNLPDNEGNAPLHFAAQAGQVECLNFLLSRCQGLEIDARNHLGFTPLMKAALQGRNKCAKLLLFAGANPTLRDSGRGLRAEQWARYCGRYVCADVIEKFARHRLLERSTSCGRWGSDSDIGGTRLVLGKVLPVPPPQGISNQPQGIKSKLRKVFRTSSGPSNSSETSSSARLVTQLTSAALCASSPVLPAAPTVPPVVKSLIRPLTVPRLQITLANGAATVTSDLNSLNVLLEQEASNACIEKPPRIKKKIK